MSPGTRLLDRANLLTLTTPEMTVLIGGMRVPERQLRTIPTRHLHRPAETLTNDFFLSGEIAVGVHVGLDGPPRAAMSVLPDGTAFINLPDANGNVIWSAP